jgi:hypothetical protein
MQAPMPMDPGAYVGVAFFAMLLGSFVVFGPIGRAFAERLRGKGKERALDTGEIEALRDELYSLRQQVSELAERQDFSERLLAQVREKGQLPAPKDS